MIKRATSLLRREVESVHAAAYILGASALASSLLGLLRDRLFAHTFGAGTELDVYFAAFRIPDLIFVLVASLVSAYALIPILEKQGSAERIRTISAITAGYGMFMVALSVIAALLLPYALRILFPGLMEAAGDDLVTMARIILLQPFFLGLSNMLASITQMRRQYILYAASPLVYNASIIAGLFFLYPRFGMSGIAWGVVAGALLHACIQLPSVLSAGFLREAPGPGGMRALVEVAMLSLPRTVALGMGQVVQVVLLSIAGTLAPGSIAVFMLAFNLQSVPLAVIGASYSVAAFPALSRMFAEGDVTRFVGQVVIASRHVIFWTTPSIALMIVLRAHLVRAALGSGAFDWTATRLTAASFAFFAFALAAQALSLLIVRAYYAAGRSYLPLLVSLVSGAASIGIALFFVSSYAEGMASFFLESLLRVEEVPGTVMLLLPFSFSVGSFLGVFLLIVLFERHFGGFIAGVSRIFWEALSAAGAAALSAYGVLALLGGIGPAMTLPAVFFHGAFAGLAGIAGAAMVYWFFGSPEFGETLATFRRVSNAETPVRSAEENVTP